jgi:F-type H+-transporting ATPase subunit b
MLIQLIFIQVVTFVGLIFVLRILFHRQLSVALARLKVLHEQNLAREEELKKELDKIKLEKEREMAKAKEVADQIIKEAKAKSEKVNLDIQTQAKTEAQKLLDQSHSDIERKEKELVSRYHKHAMDLSVEMFKFVLTEQGREALGHQLVSELIDEIENLEQDKFTVKTQEIKILSSCPLSAHEKEKLTKILSKKMGIDVSLKESIEPGIIAGLVINIGALTIDGSIDNKLKKIIPYLKTEENAGRV